MIQARSALSAVLAAVMAAGAALAAAAPALAADAPKKQPDQCFLLRNVNGFSAPDEHTLYIRVGVRDIYKLSLMTPCLDLTFRQSLGLESTAGNDWICSPLEAVVIYHEPGMHERCPVDAYHKLTADELTALPKKDRP